MKQLFRSAGVGAALLGVLGGVPAGCSDEQTGLYIEGNMAVEPPDCVASPGSTATLLLSGELDVALKPDYEALLLVGNQMTPRGDKDNLRTESMTVTITGAEVQLLDGVGQSVTEFTVPASGTIRPDGSEDPGFGVIGVTLIPAVEGARMFDEIQSRGQVLTRVARVRVFGETLGGIDVESAEITYVVKVCRGCLVRFPPESLDVNGDCNESLQDVSGDPPCKFGQDEAIDCRLCRGSNVFCVSPGDDP